ncbi:hypothetical protein DNL40_03895 [Xylanimonas oleitrophica]|uniref:LytR/CpsA/Psr regulator C-terminal domain-containing protein n=1 Tax=Xylanimonas oleitrophica TaxID=2607479 RepID=A0A2W5YGY5_9MICO|nr:LytR C-terminal domain-containing protein [Xylanimonas oleitrophica]PZR54091.1 hypothetical protein DNL40_03895 [Xylanimonas oleitrophica]
MSKSQYPYPPDEFDVRGPDDAPVGVHRSPRSGWSNAWPFLLVAVVFAGIAIGAVSLLSDDGGSAPVAEGEVTQTAPAEGDAVDPGAEGDAGEGAEEPPAEGGTELPEGEEPPADGEGAEPGQDIQALVAAGSTSAQIRVLNDKGPSGEAAKGSEALAAYGFTNLEATNYPAGGSGTSDTVVWYNEGRSDTAAAVAAILGIPSENVSQQNVRNGDVVVVINGPLTPVQ